MKVNKFRDMSEGELNIQLNELKEELFNLRFRNATTQIDNPLKIRDVRRDIARVKTVIKENALGIRANV